MALGGGPKTALKRELEAAIMRDHERYLEAFRAGDQDGVEQWCAFPIAYVGNTSVRSCERSYPFDLQKLRAKTGFARSESRTTIVACNAKKAHLLIEGRRLKADGSLAQLNSALYILVHRDGAWKVAQLSGILTDAADATPEEDAYMRARIAAPV